MITTDSPREVETLREFMNAKVQRELPAEKARAHAEQTRIAQKLQADGPRSMPGLGQKMGSVDARTYFRWQQSHPGSVRDPNFIQEMLRDSPKLRAPGYTPRKTYRATWRKVYS